MEAVQGDGWLDRQMCGGGSGVYTEECMAFMVFPCLLKQVS